MGGFQEDGAVRREAREASDQKTDGNGTNPLRAPNRNGGVTQTERIVRLWHGVPKNIGSVIST